MPCSAGLARTRLVAKVASDQAKPRGLLWVPAGVEAEFLAPLGVRRIPGIGKVTEAALHALGVERVGQLAEWSLERLEKDFGQWGTALHRKARGEDSYEFLSMRSRSPFRTAIRLARTRATASLLDAMLSRLGQKAAKRLREAGLDAGTVTVTIRYAGFETVTRSRRWRSLRTWMGCCWRRLALCLRGTGQEACGAVIGVELGNLSHGQTQLNLLDAERRAKLEKLALAADMIRDRYGFSKVQLGGSLGSGRDS